MAFYKCLQCLSSIHRFSGSCLDLTVLCSLIRVQDSYSSRPCAHESFCVSLLHDGSDLECKNLLQFRGYAPFLCQVPVTSSAQCEALFKNEIIVKMYEFGSFEAASVITPYYACEIPICCSRFYTMFRLCVSVQCFGKI